MRRQNVKTTEGWQLLPATPVNLSIPAIKMKNPSPPLRTRPLPVEQDAVLRRSLQEQEDEAHGTEDHKTIQDRVVGIVQDLEELNRFYNITISSTRARRLHSFLADELRGLKEFPFHSSSQDHKVDYLLLRNYLQRELDKLDLDAAEFKKTRPLLPFADTIILLCEQRQQVESVDPQDAASHLDHTQSIILAITKEVKAGERKCSSFTAFRAAKIIDELRHHLGEWFNFYNAYDPLFTWWVDQPFKAVDTLLETFASTVREKLVGIEPGDDAIIGEPVGRTGLIAELEAEFIPYTPEELVGIAETEYRWCEKEMKKVSRTMGFKDDWKAALEAVKNEYVPPGRQPELIRNLAIEATEFVEKHDLISIPRVASETWRMFMMTPERQKVNPFFLGGQSIVVSCRYCSFQLEILKKRSRLAPRNGILLTVLSDPTSTMSHQDKLMSMYV